MSSERQTEAWNEPKCETGGCETDQARPDGLEEGVWIASNCMTGADYPIYVGRVAPLMEREAQWLAIRQAEADGRSFWIFRGESELLEWINDYRQDARAYVDVEALTGLGLN